MIQVAKARRCRPPNGPAIRLAHRDGERSGHGSPSALAMLLLTAMLFGCQRNPTPVVAALPPLPGEVSTAPPRINGSVGSPQTSRPALVTYGTPEASEAVSFCRPRV